MGLAPLIFGGDCSPADTGRTGSRAYSGGGLCRSGGGEVLAADPHPNADRLKLCQVSSGSDSHSIVCGAENVREGLKVALALPGSVLPVGIKIEKAKIRGQVSEGMLCSSEELALIDRSDGILELSEDAKTGAPLAEYLPQVMDIAIMPNRGDCLSIRGIAREVGVLNRLPFKQPLVKSLKPQHREVIKVDLSHPQGCPLYFGRVIKGLDPSRPTPLWMKEKLESSGDALYRCGGRYYQLCDVGAGTAASCI